MFGRLEGQLDAQSAATTAWTKNPGRVVLGDARSKEDAVGLGRRIRQGVARTSGGRPDKLAIAIAIRSSRSRARMASVDARPTASSPRLDRGRYSSVRFGPYAGKAASNSMAYTATRNCGIRHATPCSAVRPYLGLAHPQQILLVPVIGRHLPAVKADLLQDGVGCRHVGRQEVRRVAVQQAAANQRPILWGPDDEWGSATDALLGVRIPKSLTAHSSGASSAGPLASAFGFRCGRSTRA